jgi:hypothetical protein
MEITTIRHPYYQSFYENWLKWRTIYEGGEHFLNNYLEKFTTRETDLDFLLRKKISYIPSFAKSAVDEIKNSIFSRMRDVSRTGGSKSYQEAILKDVDLAGSSMTSFLGRWIIPELLSMSRVGIFVDMPEFIGNTLYDTLDKRPYLYMYQTENICSWLYDSNQQLTRLLLKDCIIDVNEDTGLPEKEIYTYRLLWIENGLVNVKFYDSQNIEYQPVKQLNITQIPFVVAEISNSLLSDVANHQIALLNLGSSDMAYALSSNFPFYTEQYDPRQDATFLMAASMAQGGEAKDAKAGKTSEIPVGPTKGRRYPVQTERPGFIHPSSEPLQASIAKQEQLKNEIRQLVHLSVANIQPKMASAESKGFDNRGLEAGLSNIGLELERVERKIAEFWSMYENSVTATVNYPNDYSLRTEDDIKNEIERLKELMTSVPSSTFQKELTKRIVELSVGKKISLEKLQQIYNQIDSAKAFTIDPVIIAKNVELGVLDLNLAAELQGYPKETVNKAASDHADRLKRIAESQATSNDPNKVGQGNDLSNPASRGIPALDGQTNSGKTEKKIAKDTTQDPVVKDKVRGNGKS